MRRTCLSVVVCDLDTRNALNQSGFSLKESLMLLVHRIIRKERFERQVTKCLELILNGRSYSKFGPKCAWPCVPDYVLKLSLRDDPESVITCIS